MNSPQADTGIVESKELGFSADNVLSQDAYYTCVSDVCKYLYDTLSKHCGPAAASATWPSHSAAGSVTDHEFSKDGIDIVNHIRFPEDSVEECIRTAVAYVGRRVDDSCHDGTTTAMMVMTGFLLALINKQKSTYMKPHHMSAAIHEVLDIADEAIACSTITVSEFASICGVTEKEARVHVAYHQAMIASKGDEEMSRAISDLVSKVPIELLHGQYVIDNQVVETKSRISVVEYDADIAAKVYLQNKRDTNHNMKTEYLCEHATLLVSDNDMLNGNPFFGKLRETLRQGIKVLEARAMRTEVEAEENGVVPTLHPLFDGAGDIVMILPHADDRMHEIIDKFNMMSFAANGSVEKSRKIIVMRLQAADTPSQRAFLEGMLALAGKHSPDKYTVDIGDAFIHDARIHFQGSTVYVGNLFERTDDILTPQYLDLENAHEKYRLLLKSVEDFIENTVSSHKEMRSSDFEDAILLYRHLICQNWYSLKLGGSTHDLRASISTAKDAFGAVVSSMTDGFVFGGLRRMADRLYYEVVTRGDAEYSLHTRKVASMFIAAAEDVLLEIYGPAETQSESIMPAVISGESHALANPLAHHVYIRGCDEDSVEWLTSPEEILEKEQMLLQPSRGYYELIRRLRELLPGFATTVNYFAYTE